jgi:hypothetical protein
MATEVGQVLEVEEAVGRGPIITIASPNGVGDISWMISKFVGAKERVFLLIAEDWPQRAHQYLDLLPWLAGYKYNPHRFQEIIEFQAIHGANLKTWKDITQCGFGVVYLEPNTHLERGLRLEQWLPDLPTEFHYHLKTTPPDMQKAQKLLTETEGKHVYGLSAASYRGSEAWRTWDANTWLEFLRKWHEYDKEAVFLLMGGFWDDLTQAIASEDDLPLIDAVGKTTWGAAVEILKRIEGYVGFSSGLGIVATVLHQKAFMLWPDHQLPLSTSWAPEHMLESGEYMTSRWIAPTEVWRRFKRWLEVERVQTSLL